MEANLRIYRIAIGWKSVGFDQYFNHGDLAVEGGIHKDGAVFGIAGVGFKALAEGGFNGVDLAVERGFDNFPCAIVKAPLCRPELLCETEAVAVLPLATAGE